MRKLFLSLINHPFAKRYLHPPTLEDKDKQRAATTLNITLICLFITSIVVAVLSMTMNAELSVGLISTFVCIFVFILLLYFNQLGYVSTVASIFVFFMYVLATYNLFSSGSIRNTDITVYFLVIVIAGLLIGPRAVIATGVIATISIAGIYRLETMGLLPTITYRPYGVTFVDLNIVMIVFGTSTYLMYRTVITIHREAELAHKSARSLQHQTLKLLELNQELQNREQTIRAILNEIPDIIFRANIDGEWLDIHNAEQLFGREFRHDRLNKDLTLKFTQHFRNLAPLITQALRSGEIQRQNFRFEHNQGFHNLEARIIPSTIDEVVGIIRDVTKERQIEEAIRQAQKLDSVGMLAGGVAHDFNNWLTGVITQLTLAKKKLEKISVLQTEPADTQFTIIDNHLDKAKDASLQAAVLTHQLLTYAGRRQLKVEHLDLNKFVSNNIDLIKIAMRKKVDVVTDLHSSPLPIRCEPGQIQQVMMNLIINGSDAIVDGQGKVKVSTRLAEVSSCFEPSIFVAGRKLEEGQYAQLIVSDNGCGMDNETLSRIFDPFFSTKSHGKGLGLSSTLGIITSHDGTLQVESEEGRGTTFTVYLPLYEINDTLSIIEYDDDLSDLQALNLLVIDDETAVREAVIDLCQTQNITVFEASSGQEGINFYAQYHHKIDLVLLDIQMPGMNGIEAWHALKEIDGAARIILSSGFINDELKQNLPESPFLAKPWSSDELLNKLQYSIKQSV